MFQENVLNLSRKNTPNQTKFEISYLSRTKLSDSWHHASRLVSPVTWNDNRSVPPPPILAPSFQFCNFSNNYVGHIIIIHASLISIINSYINDSTFRCMCGDICISPNLHKFASDAFACHICTHILDKYDVQICA